MKEESTAELVAALFDASRSNIDSEQLDATESLLAAAAQLGGDADTLDELHAGLDEAYIRIEENKVRYSQDLVRVDYAPARYPNRARERGTSGWVEVMFTVTTEGETTDIGVVNAVPEEIFDESAIEAVARWTFQPLQFRGRIISQRAKARLVYRVE